MLLKNSIFQSDEAKEEDDEGEETELEDEVENAELEKTLVNGALNKRSLDQFGSVTSAWVSPVKFNLVYRVILNNSVQDTYMWARVRAPPRVRKNGGLCSSGKGATQGTVQEQPFIIEIRNSGAKLKSIRLICEPNGRMTVESPIREVVAYISVERILCSLRFTVKDVYGCARLVVKGLRYCLPQNCPACNGIFQILVPDESREVGLVTRVNTAGGKGVRLEIFKDLSAELKVALIGVTLLFDRRLLAG